MATPNPEIKAVPIHSDEGRKYLLSVLPALRELDDESAVDALVELYDLGAAAGVERGQEALKDMSQWLSRLVVAHVKKDAIAVKDILDEFVAACCIVKGGPNETRKH